VPLATAAPVVRAVRFWATVARVATLARVLPVVLVAPAFLVRTRRRRALTVRPGVTADPAAPVAPVVTVVRVARSRMVLRAPTVTVATVVPVAPRERLATAALVQPGMPLRLTVARAVTVATRV